jgi:NAD(P)-dependent dehydrogenase (short-subunit alcohol dehydrogenase family)
MTSKLCIVTGATSGIGLETAIGLAKQDWHVVMAGRNAQKAESARKKVWAAAPEAKVDVLLADFASLQAVRDLAATILKHYERIDVLVNNAGQFAMQRTETKDGFETNFGVNHLAPFLLTNLLLDRLKASGSARIVTVASVAHRRAHLDFDDLQCTRDYNWLRAYSRSKLANILFTRELAKRLQGTSVTANCLHPGIVATNIGHAGFWLHIGMILGRPFLISPAKGAETSLYLATSPEVEGISGKYFDKSAEAEPSPAAQNDADAERLWKVSSQMTAIAS